MQCARVAADDAALRAAAAGVVDWREVHRAALRHSLGPLLYWRLRHLDASPVPASVLEELQKSFHANAAHNLMMAAELGQIVGVLADNGLPVIAYKGPALAAWAYGNLALREFSDLDLLVRPPHKRRALKVLLESGCCTRGVAGALGLSGNFEAGLRTANGCNLDLHWEVSPPYFPPLDISHAWDRGQHLVVAGRQIVTFGPEDTFAVLALHGARHCWFSLSWISDIAHVVAKAPLDWDALLANRQTRKILQVAALLAAGMLEAPVPPEILTEARRDPGASPVAHEISENIFQWTGDVAGQARGALMHLRMMATLRDRGRYLWRRGLQANQTDSEHLPLPRPLRPLLYAVRPFRVLAKLGSRS